MKSYMWSNRIIIRTVVVFRLTLSSSSHTPKRSKQTMANEIIYIGTFLIIELLHVENFKLPLFP